MSDNTSSYDGIDFNALADSVDLALNTDEQDWLDRMSFTPGRGIRRGYHFCSRKLLEYGSYYSVANTGSIYVKSDLSAWPDEFGNQIVPSEFISDLRLKDYKSFKVKILDSTTLDDTGVTCAKASVKVDTDRFDSYVWVDGNPRDRFAYSMKLVRIAVAEFCEQQEISGTTAGEVINYCDMNPERNEIKIKVVAGPFETMKHVSDVFNNSGVGRICRFVTNKNLMVKGLDHNTSKEQLKSILESRYRMMEWCSQAESFIPVSVFAHHKECLCKYCEYEHYTKISKRL